MSKLRLGLMRRVAGRALLAAVATVVMVHQTSWAAPSTKARRTSRAAVTTTARNVVALPKGSASHTSQAQHSIGPTATPLSDTELRQMFKALAEGYGMYNAEPEYALAFTLSVRNWRAKPYGTLEILTPRAVGAALPSTNPTCLMDGSGDFALRLQLQQASIYLIDCTLEPVAGANATFSYQVSVTTVSGPGTSNFSSLVPLSDGHIVVGFPASQAGSTVEVFFDGQGSPTKYLYFRSCRVVPSAS
jgi:hypothetical protein